MAFVVISGTKENLKVREIPGNYSHVRKAELISQFGKDLVIIDDNDKDWPVHIGDARKTSALYRKYISK